MRFFFAPRGAGSGGRRCTRASPTPPLSALARVRASGALRWGGDLQGGEPFVSIDPAHTGALVGFEVDIADALAKHSGFALSFSQKRTGASSFLLSNARPFDIVFDGLEVTRALKAASRSGRRTTSSPSGSWRGRAILR